MSLMRWKSRVRSAGTAKTGPKPRNSLDGRYWKMLSATGASALGDGMVFVAFPLLAVALTNNPVLVATVAVAEQLPWLLFSLPAGALADRVNRQVLAVQIELLRAGLLLVFGVAIIAGYRSLIAVYLVAFLVGTCETAFWAATSAALPALVEQEV